MLEFIILSSLVIGAYYLHKAAKQAKTESDEKRKKEREETTI